MGSNPTGRANSLSSKQRLIEKIIRDVCELPDYTSPDDQPNLLQCTVEELDAILDRNLPAETPAPAAEPVRACCQQFDTCNERCTPLVGALRRKLSEARSRIVDLEREADEHAFDLSPAMVQARNDQLTAQVRRLQRALYFWLPNVPDDDAEISERAGSDAMLLVGLEHAEDVSAESLGWIRLRSAVGPDAPNWQAEITAMLDSLGPRAVRVRPGGGRENVLESLAVTLVKLAHADQSTTAPPHLLDQFCDLLRADSSYAWSWHCNIAMPIMDRLHCSHHDANEVAAELMRHLFHVDIKATPEWAQTMGGAEKSSALAVEAAHRRMVGDVRETVEIPMLTHVAGDPLVPHVGCACSTCEGARQHDRPHDATTRWVR